MNLLPGKVDASKALIVGLHFEDAVLKKRQEVLGIKSLSPNEVVENSFPVMEWLRETGVSKVLIHFDLDVIDPGDLIAAVGVDPNGLKTDEVIRIINNIAAEYDVVGLTVAEHMPRVAIKLKNILNQLPLLK
jgi:arginase